MAFHILLPSGFRYSNIFLFLIVCTLVFVYIDNFKIMDIKYQYEAITTHSSVLLQSAVNSFYEKRESWNTSKLGSILFKNEDYPVLSKEKLDKSFVILVWKRWEFLQRRHVYYFGPNRHDPLGDCSVKNCIFTGNDSLLDTADAVLVHLHTGLIPESKHRNPQQRWIFLDDESPINSFAMSKKKPKLSELANVFNWSMTYRSDADIPVPYGRIVAINDSKLRSNEPNELVPNWKIKRRDVLATILMSNCGIPYRTVLLNSLKKRLKIDIHGKCGDENLRNSCPGHFRADCKVMSQYLFYIVLENSKCKEYITEKLFYHAYSRGAIPIIQGPEVEDCKRLLPPNSYLHFDNYKTLDELVQHIKYISENEEALLSFHSWRKHFEARNEHGYFGSKSYHFCRLCEAMNYNDNKTSVYSENDLNKFLDANTLCRNKKKT